MTLVAVVLIPKRQLRTTIDLAPEEMEPVAVS